MRTTITEIDGVLHKPCPQCKRALPLTEEFWPRATRRKGGFAGWCKACHYARRDVEERRAANRRYYERVGPEPYRTRTKSWRAANRERFNANARKYAARHYAANAEAEREKRRLWRAANPERHRLQARNGYGRRKARKRSAGYSDATTAHIRALLAKASVCPLSAE